MADETWEGKDAKNVEHRGRAADNEMPKKKLTTSRIFFPKILRLEDTTNAADQPLEKRKESSIQKTKKVENAKAKELKTMTIPEVIPLSFGQSQVADQKQTMTHNDDNGCLSLPTLSMQQGMMNEQPADDVMASLKSLEAKYVTMTDLDAPLANDIFRDCLVDSLIMVQEHLGLLEETLHLSVAMVDVYLSKCLVVFQYKQFVLVGLVCLDIASRHVERFPPTIETLMEQMDDRQFQADAIAAMERRVLDALDHRLSIPTPFVFLHRFLWHLDCKDPDRELMEMMCTYILSLALFESMYSEFPASLKASASILLSRGLLALRAASNRNVPAEASKQLKSKAGVSLPRPDLSFWDDNCVQLTGYELQDLKDCAVSMLEDLQWGERAFCQGCQDKFSQPKYQSVSSHPAQSLAALNRLAVMLKRLPKA